MPAAKPEADRLAKAVATLARASQVARSNHVPPRAPEPRPNPARTIPVSASPAPAVEREPVDAPPRKLSRQQRRALARQAGR
ncbi:MAG TPA: hypothetical protein VGH33_13290 [Isosphaeraceae bacterium]